MDSSRVIKLHVPDVHARCLNNNTNRDDDAHQLHEANTAQLVTDERLQ